MRALSLWQPHAQAVALGIKPFETRGWSTDYRGPLAIHAAKRPFRHQDYPRDYYLQVGARLRDAGFPLHALDYGRVLCVVDVVGCVPTGYLRGRIGDAWEFWGDFSDFGDDGKARFAIKLSNVRLIPAHKRPLVTGRQKFFQVPDALIEEALR